MLSQIGKNDTNYKTTSSSSGIYFYIRWLKLGGGGGLIWKKVMENKVIGVKNVLD